MFFESSVSDERVRRYVTPARIVRQDGDIRNPEILLVPGTGQATIWSHPGAFMPPGSAVILDYGRELHGGIQIITGRTTNEMVVNVRVRFGESVSEVLDAPNNDHAIHNSIVALATMGATEFGNTGFRFVRIDNIEPTETIEIRELRAVFLYRDLEYLGTFECDDQRLNEIWLTGAYTVHLCLQDYLWDGIKRDRLVWMGDMHPEIMTASTVFGKLAVIERSFDLVRDETVLPKFMNGITSYSLCWLMAQDDWFRFHGDFAYLNEQRDYLKALLQVFLRMTEEEKPEKLDDFRYIDWAYYGDDQAGRGGFPALLILGLEAGARLCRALEEMILVQECTRAVEALKTQHRTVGYAKSAHALQVLAGMRDAVATNRSVLADQPLTGLTTFQGYYVLQARAMAGDYSGCLDLIRRYWGGMLDLGATTFWEHFDMAWLTNAGRIDELPSPDKVDVHRTYGKGCFKWHRNSFCHGWAGGPTAWLSEHLLGIVPVKPGFQAVKIEPRLPGLKWLDGSMPTPLGPIRVRAEKSATGKIEFEVQKPKEILL